MQLKEKNAGGKCKKNTNKKGSVIAKEKEAITVKFVVSRCAYCKLRRDFGFFCSVNHCTDGGASASHNVTCSLSLAENDSRLFKNRIAMDSGVLSKEGGRCCFILASNKNEKEQKNLRSNLNWSIIARNRTITKQRTLKQETNKTDRNPPITNHKP